MEVWLGFSDVVAFSGNPYSEVNLVLVGMNMFSGKESVRRIRTIETFKNLFPSLPMDDGEDNRMPEITFDDVLKSAPWDLDFNFEDWLNRLMYRFDKGIDYMGVICPICKEILLEDVIILLGEDDAYFCSECNILLWIKKEQ